QMKKGAITIAMMAQAPILPEEDISHKKIQSLITGKTNIKFSEPINTKNIPKDMKRNEKLEYLTKEFKKITIQLQNELNASVAHKLFILLILNLILYTKFIRLVLLWNCTMTTSITLSFTTWTFCTCGDFL